MSALDEEATDETFGRHFTHERPGCQIHYWLAGAPDAPLVALSHAALTDHTFLAGRRAALRGAGVAGPGTVTRGAPRAGAPARAEGTVTG